MIRLPGAYPGIAIFFIFIYYMWRTKMFSATHIVDMMKGPLQMTSDDTFPSSVKIQLGEMAPIVTRDCLEDETLWIHEFTEFTLFLLGKKMGIPEFWNGYPFGTPAHVVTSFISGQWWAERGSDWWEYCTPEEAIEYYSRMWKWRAKRTIKKTN